MTQNWSQLLTWNISQLLNLYNWQIQPTQFDKPCKPKLNFPIENQKDLNSAAPYFSLVKMSQKNSILWKCKQSIFILRFEKILIGKFPPLIKQIKKANAIRSQIFFVAFATICRYWWQSFCTGDILNVCDRR